MRNIEQRPTSHNDKFGGASQRRKGDRIEREIVAHHMGIGIKAERYPLSGASRFRGSGHDLDIYALGTEEAPLVCEVKARKGGASFVTQKLGDQRLDRRDRFPRRRAAAS